jgi:hypothetical protein
MAKLISFSAQPVIQASVRRFSNRLAREPLSNRSFLASSNPVSETLRQLLRQHPRPPHPPNAASRELNLLRPQTHPRCMSGRRWGLERFLNSFKGALTGSSFDSDSPTNQRCTSAGRANWAAGGHARRLLTPSIRRNAANQRPAATGFVCGTFGSQVAEPSFRPPKPHSPLINLFGSPACMRDGIW